MSKGIKFKNKNNEYVYPCPFYPVGSIYISINSTNPSTYFGGTWQQVQGRFLLGAGTTTDARSETKTFSAGSTSGEFSHVLSKTEQPSVTGGFYGDEVSRDVAIYATGCFSCGGGGTGHFSGGANYNYNLNNGFKFDNGGKGYAHNNMPPYLVVYIWKRVS